MYKKIISVLAVLAILSTACCVSAFAAIDYTEFYYVNGYKSRGNVVTSTQLASASTYCEKLGYGKAAYLIYYYTVNGVSRPKTSGSRSTFVTGSFDTYSVDYYYESDTSNVFGAIGEHKVKATSYIIWSSHACEDDSHVGGVTPDYSDVQ